MTDETRGLRRLFGAVYWKSRRAWERVALWVLGIVRRADFRPIYIDPQAVTHTVAAGDPTLTGSAKWHFGTVASGDWDRGGHPLTEYGLIYPILRARVHGAVPFEEIPEFRHNLELIAHGKTPDNCTSEVQYTEKWHRIEELARVIDRDGFLTQDELGFPDRFNEVRLQLGRDGELLLEEGIHRLIISKVLGLEAIPAIITRTHAAYDGPRRGSRGARSRQDDKV